MAHQACPVSHAALKRLELTTGPSHKVFIPNYNAAQLTFSLQRQQSSSFIREPLVLVIHKDSKLLISIRLTDVLRNASIASHVISAEPSASIVCVKVPSPDCTVTAHFENARDFHVSVYVLERAGFAVNGNLRPSLSFIDPILRPSSENLAPIRLSSLTTFPSMSQPEVFSQNPVASRSHTDPSASNLVLRTESVPTQNFSSSIPSTVASQYAVDLNPYSHFAATRVSAASPAHDYHSRSNSLLDASQTGASKIASPLHTRSKGTSAIPHSRTDPPLTMHSNDDTLRNRLAVEQLDDDSLKKASDFRQYMPQVRRLPFVQTKRKASDINAAEKPAVERTVLDSLNSETETGSDAVIGQPAKKEKLNKKVTEVRATTKIQPQKPPRTKVQSRSRHKTVTREDTKRPALKMLPVKPASNILSPTSKLSAKTISPKPSACANRKEKRPPEKVACASESRAKKNQSRKQATSATSAPICLKPIEKRKPTKSTKSTNTKGTAGSSSSMPDNAADLAEAGSRSPENKTGSKKEVECPSHEANIYKGSSQVAEAETNSTLLITESAVLDALKKMSWQIIDQYEADLSYGANRFEIAQYYVDNLYNTRFDFWHGKLAELDNVVPFHAGQMI
ncbi:uncharacterized protein BBA_07445 [Beauveria bassiana ARSEF 2860]|uniref:Uncharacterized protein n=1 Tax=Beauveria bassiana (strain ARSEF 2860) TaxID=655819 RepID=J4KM86_BEAB2|nr:uncharacterized protein BBA_07445 [Beauveria bassiana ARSEF 2860]EJP63519.1 hypothetical protein BBA_07445 [Beauveria bassiana ARSEF 2860]